MNKFSDIATLSPFPVLMKESPVDAMGENYVTAIAEEMLGFCKTLKNMDN